MCHRDEPLYLQGGDKVTDEMHCGKISKADYPKYKTPGQLNGETFVSITIVNSL